MHGVCGHMGNPVRLTSEYLQHVQPEGNTVLLGEDVDGAPMARAQG
jgi:hypothetical protein